MFNRLLSGYVATSRSIYLSWMHLIHLGASSAVALFVLCLGCRIMQGLGYTIRAASKCDGTDAVSVSWIPWEVFISSFCLLSIFLLLKMA